MSYIKAFDVQLFFLINGLAGRFPPLDSLMVAIVNDYLMPVGLSLVLLSLWFEGASPTQREKHQRGVLAAALAVGLANLLVALLNDVYFRPRPFAAYEVNLLFYRPTDSSFPSNPAAVAFSTALGAWWANRKVGLFLLAAAALFSLARIYVGVTYPMDVVGGVVVAVAAVCLALVILRVTEPVPTWLLRLGRKLYLA